MQLKGIATPDKTIIPGKKKKIVKPKLNPVVPTAPVAPTQNIVPTEGPGPLTPEEVSVQEMEDAIDKNLETPVEEPTVPTTPVEVETPVIEQPQVNIADMMRESSKSATDSLVAQLKQRIAESVQAQQANIAKAPQTYDPLRAESEVRKSQDLRSALERSSVLGDRGGIGRSEALLSQTEGENRLTDINLQQQNYIDQANQEISRLQSEGRYEEARIVADQANQLSQSLIGEQVRQEGIQREDTLLEEQRSEDAFEQQKQDFIATINRYAQDFTAQIQAVQNDNDPSNDWQIPLLESARQDKITNQNLDPNTGLPLPVDNSQAVYDRAYDKWSNDIPLTREEMQALNVTTPTKPKTSSGGYAQDTGLSDTAIRYKLTNGIPLSAEEAAKYGVNEGFVLSEGELDTQSFIDDEVNRLNPLTIDDITDKKKNVLEVVIGNPQLYDESNPEKLLKILKDNNISISELEAYEDWRDSALSDRPFQ